MAEKPKTAPAPADPRLRMMEVIIAATLRLGVTISLAVIAIGTICFFRHGTGYHLPAKTAALLAYRRPRGFPHTVGQVLRGLVALKPYAVIVFGVLLLLLTPIVRVAISIFAFLLEKDYTYVVITLFVFLMLMFSLFLGKVGA